MLDSFNEKLTKLSDDNAKPEIATHIIVFMVHQISGSKNVGLPFHEVAGNVQNGVYYYTTNKFKTDEVIYFICDVPHLLKTLIPMDIITQKTSLVSKLNGLTLFRQ